MIGERNLDPVGHPVEDAAAAYLQPLGERNRLRQVEPAFIDGAGDGGKNECLDRTGCLEWLAVSNVKSIAGMKVDRRDRDAGILGRPFDYLGEISPPG